MRLDHVLIAVTDLAGGADHIAARYGLAALPGGRHPGWGTANRIVPLGETYLELVAVVDQEEASKSVFGRWVAAGASEYGRLLGWAVRTPDLDAVARRLGLDAQAGSRPLANGDVLRWRAAGLDHATAEPTLPFFIEWERGARLPGEDAAGDNPTSLGRLVLMGDPDRLATWLGEHSLPIVVEPGPPALVQVVLDGREGEIVLGGE